MPAIKNGPVWFFEECLQQICGFQDEDHTSFSLKYNNGVLKDKLYTLCKKEKKSKRQNSCVLTIQDSLIRLKWIN